MSGGGEIDPTSVLGLKSYLESIGVFNLLQKFDRLSSDGEVQDAFDELRAVFGEDTSYGGDGSLSMAVASALDLFQERAGDLQLKSDLSIFRSKIEVREDSAFVRELISLDTALWLG